MVSVARAHKDDIYDRIWENDERFGTIYFDPGLRIKWIRELADETFPVFRQEHRDQIAHVMADPSEYDIEMLKEIFERGALKVILAELAQMIPPLQEASNPRQDKLSEIEEDLDRQKLQVDAYLKSGDFHFEKLSEFWEQLIGLQGILIGEEALLVQLEELVEDKVRVENRILEAKWKTEPFYDQAASLISAVFDTERTYCERVRKKHSRLMSEMVSYLKQVKEALDFTTAQSSYQIQRNTERLNLLFLISAIATLFTLFSLEKPVLFDNYEIGLIAVVSSVALSVVLYLSILRRR